MEPSCTKLLVCITSKTAHVSADHLDSEQLKVEITDNRCSQKLKIGIIVASPMKSVLVRSQSWAPANYEWPFIFAFKEQIRIVHFKKTVEVSYVGICDISVMCRIERNGSFFDVSLIAWMIRNIMGVIKDFWGLRGSEGTRAIAKAGELIHIEPNSRERYFLVQWIEHIDPVLCGIGMKEVNKSGSSRPYSTNKIFSSWSLDIHISFQTFIISITISNLDSCIYDWHIVIIFKNFFHSIEREPWIINGKVLEMKHVIDVAPNSVKGKVVFCVFLNDIFEVLYFMIAPSALMEA